MDDSTLHDMTMVLLEDEFEMSSELHARVSRVVTRYVRDGGDVERFLAEVRAALGPRKRLDWSVECTLRAMHAPCEPMDSLRTCGPRGAGR